MKKRTGHLFKRGKKWYLQYRVAGRKVVESLDTTKERDAKTAAERIMAPIRAADKAEALQAIQSRADTAAQEAAKLNDEAHPPLKLADAWQGYLESERRPRRAGARTLADYRGNLTLFTDWLNERNPEAVFLRDVTADDAAAFVRHLEKGGLSGNRVNKLIAFMRTFCAALEKPGRLTVNPFAEIARREHVAKNKRPFTIEELKLILETAAGEMRTLLMIGTFTGLRLGDAATLRWDETDLARAIIRRVPRKTARTGKPVIIGIPTILGEHLAALSRRGQFVMPNIAARYERDESTLCQDIQAHLKSCGIETVAPGTGFVMVKNKKGEFVRKHSGKRAVVLAGFHSLRHTFVSLHAAAGTPQAVMMKLAGHSNPAMSEHYTHLSEATARATAAALPPILADEKPALPPVDAAARVKELAATLNAKTWKPVKAELEQLAATLKESHDAKPR